MMHPQFTLMLSQHKIPRPYLMCAGAKIPAVYNTIATSSVQSSRLCIIKQRVQRLMIKYTPLD